MATTRTDGEPGSSRREPGSRTVRLLRHAAPWLLAVMLVLGLPSVFPELVRKAAPVLLYHPTSLPADRSAPATWGLSAGEEVWLETSDGPRIHGWWVPARVQPRCGSLIFFHGNAGNIGGRAPLAHELAGRGLDVLLVDYRGYGRSEGRPSEEGLYRDARAAYRHLREVRGIPAGEIVVAGHSLGGAVAVLVASEHPVGAAILTSTFTNLTEAARAVYPWLPSAWFRWDPPPFPTRRRMRELDAPVLVGRGGGDHLIPRRQVRALYHAASSPREWVEVPDADHGGLWFQEEFQRALTRFLARHLDDCPPAGESGD